MRTKDHPCAHHVLAVDPSLSSTGYAYRNPETGELVSGAIIQKEKVGARNLDRLHYIATALIGHADAASADLLVIEGYAFGFGPSASRSHSLGEIGGIVKYEMWRRGMDILIVPPNSLKLFMLGRYKTVKVGSDGKKSKVKVKDLVKLAAEAQAGREFRTNDQADAFALLTMGEGFKDSRLLPRVKTAPKRVALDGCDLIAGRDPAYRRGP